MISPDLLSNSHFLDIFFVPVCKLFALSVHVSGEQSNKTFLITIKPFKSSERSFHSVHTGCRRTYLALSLPNSVPKIFTAGPPISPPQQTKISV